jgi:hypothetical protein
MRWRISLCSLAAACLIGSVGAVPAADLAKLPPNTWVEIKHTTEQPNTNPEEQGRLLPAGWNKLVYDPDGKRVLFYDRWFDKKHGGFTIYGNCLFGFDAAAARLKPIKIDNWTKMEPKQGGYRTLALAENEKEPTPCPRHVYHAFEYVPELKALFICNGANQTVLDKAGKLIGHDECNGAWRLDIKTNQWARIRSAEQPPPNMLDDGMAYCPTTKSIIYAGYNRQLWVLDLAKSQWRKAKNSPPRRTAFGQAICYDPSKQRMLIVGGGPLDGWKKGKAAEFREVYAFDPRTETVQRLADGPTAFYAQHLAYDKKRELFVAVAVFDKKEQPSGMFAYDPKKDAWREIQPKNSIPPHNGWFGWMKLCYDSHNDCFIGMIRDKFFAFRGVSNRPARPSFNLAWADMHHQRTGARPSATTGRLRIRRAKPDVAGHTLASVSGLAIGSRMGSVPQRTSRLSSYTPQRMESGRMMPRRIWPFSDRRTAGTAPACGGIPSPRAAASLASRRKCCRTKLEYSTV